MSYEDEVKARHAQRAQLRKFLGSVAGLTDEEIELGIARIADALKLPTPKPPFPTPATARRTREDLTCISAILVACLALRTQGKTRRSRWAWIKISGTGWGAINWIIWITDIGSLGDCVMQDPEAMQEQIWELACEK